MPRYIYKCEKCENECEYFHSMTEKIEYCEQCKEKTLYKIPSFSGIMKKNIDKKVGSIVDSYIAETKEEIRKEKEQLTKKEYVPK